MKLIACYVVIFCVALSTHGETNPSALGIDEKAKPVSDSTAFGLTAATNPFPITLDNATTDLLRDATQDKWFKRETLVSVILGGLIAALAGYGASWYSHWLETKRNEQEETEFRKNVLGAIRRELEALGEIYDQGIGLYVKVLPENRIFDVRLAITQEWFTVFNANAVHIGKLPEEIARLIVTTYALIKSLIEEFRMNNGYITLLEEVEFQILQREGEQHLKIKKSRIEQMMINQATRIKDADAAVKKSVAEFFKILDPLQTKPQGVSRATDGGR